MTLYLPFHDSYICLDLLLVDLLVDLLVGLFVCVFFLFFLGHIIRKKKDISLHLLFLFFPLFSFSYILPILPNTLLVLTFTLLLTYSQMTLPDDR